MMTDAEKPMFVAALAELALLKPGANLTQEAYKAWWNAMRDRWTLEEFQRGCVHLRDSLEFMPNPYHFEQLRKQSRCTAGEAWSIVLECARKGLELPADELLRRSVTAIGGIRTVMMSDMDKTHFLAKRFEEHYGSIQEAEDIRGSVPQVTGGRRLALQGIAKQLARSKR